MGLDVNSTKVLLYASRQGVSFERTATIGRQGLYLTTEALAKNLRLFGYPNAERLAEELLRSEDGFCEPFLRLLGAREIRSFDASSYENATDRWDFNEAIDAKYRGQFTAVVDGGTLEHVFNFPVAIRNCMEMVAVGGHFVSITPANNFLGHGFYQFSPELFFRVLDARSGFSPRVILFEDVPDAEWFEVTDPDTARVRVTLVNSQPTYLAVIAAKSTDLQVRSLVPQQSDYVAMWQDGKATALTRGAGTTRRRGLLRSVVHAAMVRMPDGFRRAVYRRMRYLADQSTSNARFYRRLNVP